MRSINTIVKTLILTAFLAVVVTLPANAGSALVITDVTKLEPVVAVSVVNLSLQARAATVTVVVVTASGKTTLETRTVTVPALTKVRTDVAFASEFQAIQQVGISEDPSPM